MLNDQRVPSPVYGSIGNKCENMLKYDEHMVKTWRNHGERNVEQRWETVNNRSNNGEYPLVIEQFAIENGHRNSGFIH